MPSRKTLGETCEELRGHLRESKTREKRAREEIEVATKILRQKEEDIQQKDVLISSKSRRIGELERDMASSHNALADMFLCPITNELPVDPSWPRTARFTNVLRLKNGLLLRYESGDG